MLLGAVRRHGVPALGDDQIGNQPGTELRTIEDAQRRLCAGDVTAARARDHLLDVATAHEVTRYVVPLGRELPVAHGLRHLAAVRALAEALGDRMLDDLLPKPRGLFGSRLLLSLRGGRLFRLLFGVAVALGVLVA